MPSAHAALQRPHPPSKPVNTAAASLDMETFPEGGQARMNAQTDAPAQALMLFVASYKNCSSCDIYRCAFRAHPQPCGVLASWHSPCSIPWQAQTARSSKALYL